MSDRDEGYCYWMGEPINAMTREAAIEALGKAILIIAWKIIFGHNISDYRHVSDNYNDMIIV